MPGPLGQQTYQCYALTGLMNEITGAFAEFRGTAHSQRFGTLRVDVIMPLLSACEAQAACAVRMTRNS